MRVRRLWDCLRQTITTWFDDKAPRMGAALAYYSTFSMAPLLILVIWIAGLVFGEEAARGEVFAQLNSTLGPRAAAAVEQMVQASHDDPQGIWATIVGVGLLLMGATGAFLELQDALNTIWRVEPKRTAGWLQIIRNRFISLAMVVGCGFLLLVSHVVSTALAALHAWVASTRLPGGAALWQVVHISVSVFVITGLFAMIFKLLPDARLRWRDMWLGAFLTALLFTFGKFLIGLYLAHGSVASSFGAAGTLAVWLVWVYYSSLLVLFGAEFTRVYANHGEKDQTAAPPKSLAQPNGRATSPAKVAAG